MVEGANNIYQISDFLPLMALEYVMKQLPSGKTEIGPVKVHEGQADEAPSEKIARLEARVLTLERELAGSQDKYAYLKGVYDRLADTWNAFQATARPTVRNVHRAESSGEGARKLAEVLIGLMYDTATVKDLIKLLQQVANPMVKVPDDAPRRDSDRSAARRGLPEGP